MRRKCGKRNISRRENVNSKQHSGESSVSTSEKEMPQKEIVNMVCIGYFSYFDILLKLITFFKLPAIIASIYFDE